MKICFIGLGSIGKRHLMNSINLLTEYNLEMEIHALRNTNKLLSKDIVEHIDKQLYTYDELDNDYDIVFIANPTYLHYETIKVVSDKTKNMFIEKPVFDSVRHDLGKIKLSSDGIYYVASPLRYKKVIQYLKNNLNKEEIFSIRAICSSYLPDWRPNIDYRKVYSAKKDEGGGVSIDLIHEWDYLTYLFGFPQKVYNLRGKFSQLEIDSEDLSIYIGSYRDKLLELHLDYFGRVPKREIEIFTKQGTIVGDLIMNRVNFSSNRKDIRFDDNDPNIMYLEEMRNFFDMILHGKKNKNDITNAYEVLKLSKELL
ncbi:MAG: hypothetical protein APF77_24475 [Clostridia bacterium BRH_c25]|nr:MAG: hypothetical protein APF77_24475 [Clostridia bacterium BRH_c25]